MPWQCLMVMSDSQDSKTIVYYSRPTRIKLCSTVLQKKRLLHNSGHLTGNKEGVRTVVHCSDDRQEIGERKTDRPKTADRQNMEEICHNTGRRRGLVLDTVLGQ